MTIPLLLFFFFLETLHPENLLDIRIGTLFDLVHDSNQLYGHTWWLPSGCQYLWALSGMSCLRTCCWAGRSTRNWGREGTMHCWMRRPQQWMSTTKASAWAQTKMCSYETKVYQRLLMLDATNLHANWSQLAACCRVSLPPSSVLLFYQRPLNIDTFSNKFRWKIQHLLATTNYIFPPAHVCAASNKQPNCHLVTTMSLTKYSKFKIWFDSFANFKYR